MRLPREGQTLASGVRPKCAIQATPIVKKSPKEIPGPAEESALSHASDEIGTRSIAKPIALIHRTPELVGALMHGQANAGAPEGAKCTSHGRVPKKGVR